jgi:hypothetical protein
MRKLPILAIKIEIKKVKELIKKYTILFIVFKILTLIVPAILLAIVPDLLTTELPDGGSRTLGIGYLETEIRYFLNLVTVVFIYHDMKNLNLKSILLLILTIFSSATGIFFFLFFAYERKNNILKNEKRITQTLN